MEIQLKLFNSIVLIKFTRYLYYKKVVMKNNKIILTWCLLPSLNILCLFVFINFRKDKRWQVGFLPKKHTSAQYITTGTKFQIEHKILHKKASIQFCPIINTKKVIHKIRCFFVFFHFPENCIFPLLNFDNIHIQ